VTEINRAVGATRVRAATAKEAAELGEVILLAVPWRKTEAWPDAEAVRGKIVIDAMNPYTGTGGIADLGASTSSEEVLKRLPGARLVKAFNTIFWQHLAEQARPDLPLPKRRAIFLAGDDVEAKRIVSRLIEEIGFAPIDTGTLREGGRSQQPGTPVYNRNLTQEEAVGILAAAH
jgi:predicted dinucleotide-binding enzyme